MQTASDFAKDIRLGVEANAPSGKRELEYDAIRLPNLA